MTTKHSTLHLHISKGDLKPIDALFINQAQSIRAAQVFKVRLFSPNLDSSFALSTLYDGENFRCYSLENDAAEWEKLTVLVEQRGPILDCWLARGDVQAQCRVVLASSPPPTYNYWHVRELCWKEKVSFGRVVKWAVGKLVHGGKQEKNEKRDSGVSVQSKYLDAASALRRAKDDAVREA